MHSMLKQEGRDKMKIKSINGCYNNNVFEMIDEEPPIFAEYEDIDGYGKITLEQWGSDPDKKLFVVYIFHYNGDLEVSESFPVDCSEGWETMRHSYRKAAMLYNTYMTDDNIIPCF